MADDLKQNALELVLDAVDGWRTDNDLGEDEALDRLSLILDQALDFEMLLAFPIGVLVESGDRAAIRAGLKALAKLLAAARPDPDRLRDRATKADARGRPHVAARRRRRADRLEARTERG